MSLSSDPPVCAEVRAAAAALSSLLPTDPERAVAEKHAAACPDCSRALRDGALVWRLLEEDRALAGPSPEALRRASRAVLAEFPAEAKRGWTDRALIATAALAGAGLIWAFERRVIAGLSSLTEMAQPVAFAIAAAALVMLSSARPRLALGAMMALAAMILVGDGRAAAGGVEAAGCVGLELLAALVPLASTALVIGRRPGASPLVYATAAAAGAVAAEASLHLLCPHHSLAHIVVAHFGGVVVAALVGAAAGLGFQRPLETP